jgi:hypothetical protein
MVACKKINLHYLFSAGKHGINNAHKNKSALYNTNKFTENLFKCNNYNGNKRIQIGRKKNHIHASHQHSGKSYTH